MDYSVVGRKDASRNAARTCDSMPNKYMRCINHLICLVFLLPAFGQAETLEGLISSALHGHPAIQAQQAQEQAAKAGADSASWQFFPTPSVTIEKAETSATDRSYQGDGVVSTLRLQQPLWTGGRLTAIQEKADAGVIASQASLEETRQQLALRVLQAYGEWLAAHLKTQANEKSLATHIRLREQVKRRIGQGASADSDLVLAVGRLQAVAADLAVTRSQKDIALARLGQLVGHPVDTSALISTIAAPRKVNSGVQALLNLALASNPTIQKAQAQAKVQEALISERRADLSPEVYLRAERQYGNFSFNNGSPDNRLFLGLSTRFGPGLSSLSNVDGARSQHQAALAEVEVQSRAVGEQILSDHALFTALESRFEELRASLKAAEQVSESYDRQFLAGRKTWQDVMNAARELTQTEVQLADIQSTQVVVTWRLAIYTDRVFLADINRSSNKSVGQLPAKADKLALEPLPSIAATVAALIPPPTLVPTPALAVSPALSYLAETTRVPRDTRQRFAQGKRPLMATDLMGSAVQLQLARTLSLPVSAEKTSVSGLQRAAAADGGRP